MELAVIAARIISYRAYTGLSKADFAKRIGVAPRTLTRLESGEPLPKSTADPFVRALKKRDIHPGQPIPVVEKKKPIDKRFAQVELPVSIKDEQGALTTLVQRYQVRIRSWNKSHPRKGAADTVELIVSQLLDEQGKSPITISTHRQCLLIGMIQGMMLTEGILSIKEALDDHNSLYYVS